ncbi:olfactory receptor 6F1-like [Ambystoma mexicanum]|uniref:olfactory receptor 6F1-like n=1 Tax=Ambystoma mexicanum TaxID=8296 RepID=UPI0037E707C0
MSELRRLSQGVIRSSSPLLAVFRYRRLSLPSWHMNAVAVALISPDSQRHHYGMLAFLATSYEACYALKKAGPPNHMSHVQSKLKIMNNTENGNRTITSEFIILGFEVVRELQLFLFTLFMALYILTIGTNMLIITVVKLDRTLHKPMYYFLANFSFLEVLYTTVTVPKMLVALLTEKKGISVPDCIAQFYFLFGFGASENCLLAVMAYDRYVAICNPLRYATIITHESSTQLAIGAWLSGMFAAFPPALWISTLTFCTPNEINHFFCDYAPLLKLSCKDTSVGEFTFLVMAWSVILGCCLLTMVSYAFIINAILRIPSTEGQVKAFNTCASHLTVVSIFYGTVIYMYIRPNSSIRFPLDKVVSIFYCVVTPVLNPMIYSLRNKEVRDSLKKTVYKCKTLCCDAQGGHLFPQKKKEIGKIKCVSAG